ncbi:E3 ubiquitin-protein ligase RLIM [Glycine soja]|nr:E3 ubiquitin-protein ligase RLIM [Glycine soja]
MTRQFQQPTLFSDVANKINHMVYISIVVTTLDPSSAARHCRLQLPLQHDIFNHLFQTSFQQVGTPFFSIADELPSRELVQRMACDGGDQTFFAFGGNGTQKRFMVQNEEEDPCAICINAFNSGDNAARLPCSHVFHPNCILQWFVQKSMCPLCCFTCSDRVF